MERLLSTCAKREFYQVFKHLPEKELILYFDERYYLWCNFLPKRKYTHLMLLVC